MTTWKLCVKLSLLGLSFFWLILCFLKIFLYCYSFLYRKIPKVAIPRTYYLCRTRDNLKFLPTVQQSCECESAPDLRSNPFALFRILLRNMYVLNNYRNCHSSWEVKLLMRGKIYFVVCV